MFFECPDCKVRTKRIGSLRLSDNTLIWRCETCNYQSIDSEEWKQVKCRSLAFKCPICKTYTLGDALFGYFQEIVCKECDTLVSINGKHISKYTSLTKNDLQSSEKISDNLYFLRVKTKRQKTFVRILNQHAMKEETNFKVMPRPTVEKANDHQFVIHSKRELLGYLSFTPNRCDGMPILNQIYVTPNYRKKGYAVFLVNRFIDECCDRTKETLFIVESPNHKTHSLIFKKLKLGDKVATINLP